MRKLTTLLLICVIGVIQAFAQTSTDVSATGLTPTGGTICDGTYPVSVTVNNLDPSYPTTPFSVDYYLDGVLIISVPVTVPIAGGGNAVVPLGVFGNKPGKHTLSAVANYPGDIVPLNNVVSNIVVVQFNGTYTIGPNPNDTYSSVKKAVDSVNTYGLCGATVFNCQAGGSEINSEILLFTNTTNATRTLTFNGNGWIINAGVGVSTSTDGIIKIAGTDYVTIDGFVINENAANLTATTQMEWGIALVKRTNSAPFDGCQYTTIKNCIITLNRTNVNAVGIYANNHISGATTTLTITAPGDAHSYNKIDGNVISNVFSGIYINGYSDATPYALYDQGNEIGVVKGNRIFNYAGSSATAYGIYVRYQNNAKIINNNINNIAGGGIAAASTIYGIFHAASVNSVATISYDTVSLSQGANSSQVAGIASAVSGTRKLTMNNNLVQNITAASGATGGCYAIGMNISGAGYPDSLIVNNNRVINSTNLATTGSFYGFYCSGSSSYVQFLNNKVNNINKLSAGGTFYGYYNNGSPSSNRETITGFKVSNITLTGATAFQGITSTTGSGQNKTITYDTITAITGGSGTSYGINSTLGNTVDLNNCLFTNATFGAGTVYGISGTGGTTLTFNNNLVNSITGGSTLYGMQIGSTTVNDYLNVVNNITSSGTSSVAYGLYLTTTTTGNHYRNEVYNVSESGTSGVVYGIHIGAGTTHNIYNNFVSDLRTPVSGSATAIYGMNLASGTNVNVYYNTIYLNATSTGAIFGTSGIYASTSPTLDLRNNIVINKSTPNSTGYVTAFRRSGVSLTSYASTSNNNLFYAGTPGANNLIFYDGTTPYQSLASFKVLVAPRDANSVTESTTPFNNVSTPPYNLHLTNAVATQCESGGTRITSPFAITNDFDNNTRWGETGYSGTGTGVDIGADEGNFTSLDLTGPSISYTALPNTTSTTTVAFTNVTITDPSGVDTTTALRARCYFKKKTNSNTFNDNTSATDGWKYVKANGQTSPFDFTINESLINGGVAVGDTIQYFVVAQDKATTPNVSLNSGVFAAGPTDVNLTSAAFPLTGTINYYKILPSICGNFTIGNGGNFATITAAVADLNSKMISCPVVYTLLDTLYRSAETYPIVINANPGSSATNTVTFKPATGVNAKIKGSATALLKLNGIDYITFDGSNNGTTSQNLTIQDTLAGTSAPIWVASTGTAAGATNVVIKNCKILAGSNTSTTYGIFAGASSSVGTAGADNDNLTIQNNDIQKTYYGIYIYATAGGPDNNLNILNNSVGSTLAANYIGNTGIYTSYVDGATISGNSIFKVVYTSGTPVGLSLNTGTVNTTVSKNTIKNIEYQGTGGYGGRGIFCNSGVSTSNITIVNNFIAEILGDGYSSFSGSSPVGMYFDGTNGGVNVWFNSVYMSGTLTRATNTITTAILFNTATLTGFDVRNNIFMNSMNNTSSSTAKNYAIFSSAAGSAFTKLDYNDYYVSGAQGVLGSFAAADVLTLGAWKTATVKDTNSINVDPAFNSTTDLHTTSVSVYRNGKAISGVTTDIDGDARFTTPCIGADEFTLASGDAGITAINRAYCPGTQSVVVTLKNFGGTDLNNVKIDWSVNSVPQTQNIWNGTLAPGATTNVTLTPSYTFAGATAYTIIATTSLPNGVPDGNTSNDSKTEAGIYTGLQGTIVIGPAGTYTTLTAAAADMNSSGICGAVVLELNAAYVSTGETFPIVFNQIAGASPINTITIRPGSGVTATISGSSSSSIIKLNGTDYLTIEGSNNGTTSRDLTISNTSTSGSTAGVWIGSTGTGAKYNTIKNCNIACGSNSTSSVYGIVSGSGASISSSGADNDTLTLQNNVITKTYYGIYINGLSTGIHDKVTIKNNVIGSTVAASKLGNSCLYMTQVNNALVENNDMFGIVQSSSHDAVTISTGVTNSTFSKNKIHDLLNSSTNRVAAFNLGSGAGSNLTFVNNAMYSIIGNGTAGNTYGTYGFYINAGDGYKLYYNSVNLTGDRDAAGSTKPTSISACVFVGAGASFDFRNNIFSNTQTAATNGPKSYAIYSAVANTAYTNINYNDYYVSGAQGMLGYLGSNMATLSAWQGATLQDANSISMNPGFVSVAEHHILINNGNVNGKAMYMPAVTDDLDGDLRNVTTPDMGADEYNPITKDLELTSILAPGASTCYTANESFIAKVTNPGIDTVFFASTPVTVTGIVTGPNPQTYNNTLNTGYLATGQSTNVTFTTTYNMLVQGNYTFDSYFTWNLDQNHSNDSVAVPVVRTSASPNVDSIRPTNSTICQGSSVTLNSYSTAFGSVSSYFTKDTVKVIPDPGYATSEIISTYPGAANQIVSAVIDSLKHTYVSDLVIGLMAPDGSYADLSVENGGSGDNFLHTVFTMGASTAIGSGTAPFTGSYIPDGSLTALTGSATGTWKLIMADLYSSDQGTLYKWSLNFPPASNTIVSYSWAPATGLSSTTVQNPVATPSTTTTYTLTVTDARGCTATGTVTVNVNPAPVPVITGTNSVCAGTTAVLYKTQYGMSNYVWTVSAGGTITGGGTTTDSTVTVTWNTAGAQSVSVNYNGLNNCPGVTATVYNVTVKPLPTAVVSVPSPTICNGDILPITITLSGAGPWTLHGLTKLPQGGSPQVLPDTTISTSPFTLYDAPTANASYYVSNYTDNSTGCQSDTANWVSITVNPIPTASITTSADTVCVGSTVDFTITLSGTGPWLLHGLTMLPQGGSPQVMPDTIVTVSPFVMTNVVGYTADYYLQSFTDQSTGCFSDTANWVNVVAFASPVVALGNDTTICGGQTITLDAFNAGSTYLWSTTETTSSVVIDSAGLGFGVHPIHVGVTRYGCTVYDTINITFDPCTGFEEFSDGVVISLVPNPSTGLFYLSVDGMEGNTTIAIFDITGQNIYSEEVDANGIVRKPIDLTGFAKGVYFVRVNNGTVSHTEKLIVN